MNRTAHFATYRFADDSIRVIEFEHDRDRHCFEDDANESGNPIAETISVEMP